VARQLTEFLEHVAHRTAPEADVRRCGVEIALLLQAMGGIHPQQPPGDHPVAESSRVVGTATSPARCVPSG
jgi:hypothetical protein